VTRDSASKTLQPLDLNALRGRLNGIDETLLDQFIQRIDIARQVAAYKHQSGLPVFDAEREVIVAARARARFPDPDGIRAESLIKSLMRLSREVQYDVIEPKDCNWEMGMQIDNAPNAPERTMRIVCQGSPGAYSMAAGAKLFPRSTLIPASTFADACTLVLEGQADLAVLPLENSTAGTVDDVYDLLQSHKLYIIQSSSLPISHRLMAIPGTRLDQIRNVISHPQALAQCQGYIQRKGWQTQESTNTAHAAAFVASVDDPSLAAIASEEAARIHGLQIIDHDICDSGHNQTRFIVISRTLVISPAADRVSLILSLPHQSGALAATLSMFSDRGINLLKIQSRPDPQKAWNYRFYLDFESPPNSQEALLVLYQLDREMPYLQLLGWYSESDKPEF
jgi:chorismate mutase/prephenate dehydratase